MVIKVKSHLTMKNFMYSFLFEPYYFLFVSSLVCVKQWVFRIFGVRILTNLERALDIGKFITFILATILLNSNVFG